MLSLSQSKYMCAFLKYPTGSFNNTSSWFSEIWHLNLHWTSLKKISTRWSSNTVFPLEIWSERDSLTKWYLIFYFKDCYSLTTIVVDSHKRTLWWTNCYLNQYNFQQLLRNHCLTNPEKLWFPEGNAPLLQEGKTRFGMSFGEITPGMISVEHCCDSGSVCLLWNMVINWSGNSAIISFH